VWGRMGWAKMSMRWWDGCEFYGDSWGWGQTFVPKQPSVLQFVLDFRGSTLGVFEQIVLNYGDDVVQNIAFTALVLSKPPALKQLVQFFGVMKFLINLKCILYYNTFYCLHP